MERNDLATDVVIVLRRAMRLLPFPDVKEYPKCRCSVLKCYAKLTTLCYIMQQVEYQYTARSVLTVVEQCRHRLRHHLI